MSPKDSWVEALPSARLRASTLAMRAQKAFGQQALGLPERLVRALAGPPIERDGHRLDPQIQLSLRLSRIVGVKPTHLSSVAEARALTESSALLLAPTSGPLASVRDLILHANGTSLRARVYRPNGPFEVDGGLVFFHGGGWVVGSLDSHDAPCRAIAEASGCMVIAIDYRLAPEHPFPAAVDDALAGFRAVVAVASDLGVDPRRLAVGGDSAGGNLAAVVARETRGDSVRPAFQLLVYPVTDASMSTGSYRSCGEGFFLERASMAWYFDHYVPRGINRSDPRVSPLLADDCEGLPPGLVLTAGFDPLRDEGEAYARKVGKSGVALEHRSYGSLIHAFLNMGGGVGAARRALSDLAMALRAAIGNPEPLTSP